MHRVHMSGRAVAALVGIALVVGGLLLTGVMLAYPRQVDVTITTRPGETLGFTPEVVVVPAETTVRVAFQNVSIQEHNLTFLAPISRGSRTIVDAGATDSIVIRTPGAGVYTFVCTIHMEMSGTLEVR